MGTSSPVDSCDVSSSLIGVSEPSTSRKWSQKMKPFSHGEFSEMSRALLAFGEPRSDDEMARMMETVRDREAAAIWIAKFAAEYLSDGAKTCLEKKIHESWPWIAESLPYRIAKSC